MLVFFSGGALLAVIILWMHWNYPLIYNHKMQQSWTVGVAVLDDTNRSIEECILSTIDAVYIKEQTGFDQIADPWIVKLGSFYYLFVEVLDQYHGELAVFTSQSLREWIFEGLVLDEPFHLSYPQIIPFKNKYYLLPESAKAHQVMLYEAVDFPLKWKKVATLLEGCYLDSTYFEFDGIHYLINIDGDYRSHLFYSHDLVDGKWQEHPKSPLGIGNRLRPAGKPRVQNNQVIVPVQCRRKGYGTAVYSIILKELTIMTLKFNKGPVLLKSNHSVFFNEGMHHLVYWDEGDRQVVAFDGRGGTNRYYKMVNIKRSVKDNVYDLLTFLHLPYKIGFLDKW